MLPEGRGTAGLREPCLDSEICYAEVKPYFKQRRSKTMAVRGNGDLVPESRSHSSSTGDWEYSQVRPSVSAGKPPLQSHPLKSDGEKGKPGQEVHISVFSQGMSPSGGGISAHYPEEARWKKPTPRMLNYGRAVAEPSPPVHSNNVSEDCHYVHQQPDMRNNPDQQGWKTPTPRALNYGQTQPQIQRKPAPPSIQQLPQHHDSHSEVATHDATHAQEEGHWKRPTPRSLCYGLASSSPMTTSSPAQPQYGPKLASHPLNLAHGMSSPTPRNLHYSMGTQREQPRIPASPRGMGGASLILTPRAVPRAANKSNGFPPMSGRGKLRPSSREKPPRTMGQREVSSNTGVLLKSHTNQQHDQDKLKPELLHQQNRFGVVRVQQDGATSASPSKREDTSPGGSSSNGTFLVGDGGEVHDTDCHFSARDQPAIRGGLLKEKPRQSTKKPGADPPTAPKPLLTKATQLDKRAECEWATNGLSGRNDVFDGLATPRNALEAKIYLAQYTRLMLELADRVKSVGTPRI